MDTDSNSDTETPSDVVSPAFEPDSSWTEDRIVDAWWATYGHELRRALTDNRTALEGKCMEVDARRERRIDAACQRIKETEAVLNEALAALKAVPPLIPMTCDVSEDGVAIKVFNDDMVGLSEALIKARDWYHTSRVTALSSLEHLGLD